MNDSRRSSASRLPRRLASESRATHWVAVANCTRWPARQARIETAIARWVLPVPSTTIASDTLIPAGGPDSAARRCGTETMRFRREATPLRQETRMSQCVASWIAAADRFPLWLGGMTHRRVARIAVRSNRIGSQSSPCNTSATVLGNVARAPTQTRGGRRRVAGTRRWYYIEDFDVCAEFLVTWRHPLQG